MQTDFIDVSSVGYGKVLALEHADAATTYKSQYNNYSHIQPDGPKKLAQLIVNTAVLGERPARLVAGSDALSMSRDTLKNRMEELKKRADPAVSTDFQEAKSLF